MADVSSRNAAMTKTFDQIADERWAEILATGKTVSWHDAKIWLEARSQGKNPPKTVARKPAR